MKKISRKENEYVGKYSSHTYRLKVKLVFGLKNNVKKKGSDFKKN